MRGLFRIVMLAVVFTVTALWLALNWNRMFAGPKTMLVVESIVGNFYEQLWGCRGCTYETNIVNSYIYMKAYADNNNNFLYDASDKAYCIKVHISWNIFDIFGGLRGPRQMLENLYNEARESKVILIANKVLQSKPEVNSIGECAVVETDESQLAAYGSIRDAGFRNGKRWTEPLALNVEKITYSHQDDGEFPSSYEAAQYHLGMTLSITAYYDADVNGYYNEGIDSYYCVIVGRIPPDYGRVTYAEYVEAKQLFERLQMRKKFLIKNRLLPWNGKHGEYCGRNYADIEVPFGQIEVR